MRERARRKIRMAWRRCILTMDIVETQGPYSPPCGDGSVGVHWDMARRHQGIQQLVLCEITNATFDTVHTAVRTMKGVHFTTAQVKGLELKRRKVDPVHFIIVRIGMLVIHANADFAWVWGSMSCVHNAPDCQSLTPAGCAQYTPLSKCDTSHIRYVQDIGRET